MGFRSPKAEKCAMVRTGHHKAWQRFIIGFNTLLTIGFNTRTNINVISVIAIRSVHTLPTPAGFHNFAQNAYRMSTILNVYTKLYIIATILWQWCQPDMFEICWFIWSHPQMCGVPSLKIINHSLMQRQYSKGDFRNKWIYQMVGPGVPSDNKWIRICRNLDKRWHIYARISHKFLHHDKTSHRTII